MLLFSLRFGKSAVISSGVNILSFSFVNYCLFLVPFFLSFCQSNHYSLFELTFSSMLSLL